jgi:hypothetical protein
MRSLVLSLVLALPLFAAQPYHLELEANPAAAFPYLGKFGSMDVHVYQSGVRTNALWLRGFSRNGDKAVTVVNPLARLYVDVGIEDIAPIVTKLSGGGGIERLAAPALTATTKGTVKGIAATRYRLTYGPGGYIDYWTTDAIPENAQFRAIVQQLVGGISPRTAQIARGIRGTPVYVELNFRRFKKVPLLSMKKLTRAADDEADALTLGSFYARASVLEKLWD